MSKRSEVPIPNSIKVNKTMLIAIDGLNEFWIHVGEIR